MKFKIIKLNEIKIWFYKTALFAAIEEENIEIVKLLLANNKLDINIINIFQLCFHSIQNHIILIAFKIIYFNEIQNSIFQ